MPKLNPLPLPPNIPTWGNWASRAFGRFCLRVLGWHFEGEIPNVSKAVLIAAPHTSSWDWPIGMFAILGIGLKVYWMGKTEFVNGRFQPILKWLGGVPIDRSAAKGVVQQTVAQFQARDTFILALAPEGTRSAVSKWKLGFYYIAQSANVPIVPVALDYGRNCVHVGPCIPADQNIHAVFTQIAQFYDGVKGKVDENAALTLDKMIGD